MGLVLRLLNCVLNKVSRGSDFEFRTYASCKIFFCLRMNFCMFVMVGCCKKYC